MNTTTWLDRPTSDTDVVDELGWEFGLDDTTNPADDIPRVLEDA